MSSVHERKWPERAARPRPLPITEDPVRARARGIADLFLTTYFRLEAAGQSRTKKVLVDAFLTEMDLLEVPLEGDEYVRQLAGVHRERLFALVSVQNPEMYLDYLFRQDPKSQAGQERKNKESGAGSENIHS